MLRIAHIPTHHTSAGLIIRTSAYQSGLPASAPSNSLPSVPVLSLPAKFPAVSTRRASRHEEVRDRGDPRGQVMGRSLKRSRTVYMVEEIGRPSLVRTAIPVSISEGIEKANPVGQGKPGGLRSEDLVIRQKAAHGSVTPPGRTRPWTHRKVTLRVSLAIGATATSAPQVSPLSSSAAGPQPPAAPCPANRHHLSSERA